MIKNAGLKCKYEDVMYSTIEQQESVELYALCRLAIILKVDHTSSCKGGDNVRPCATSKPLRSSDDG